MGEALQLPRWTRPAPPLAAGHQPRLVALFNKFDLARPGCRAGMPT